MCRDISSSPPRPLQWRLTDSNAVTPRLARHPSTTACALASSFRVLSFEAAFLYPPLKCHKPAHMGVRGKKESSPSAILLKAPPPRRRRLKKRPKQHRRILSTALQRSNADRAERF